MLLRARLLFEKAAQIGQPILTESFGCTSTLNRLNFLCIFDLNVKRARFPDGAAIRRGTWQSARDQGW